MFERAKRRLTRKQREAILRRDDYHSQMRHYSEERGWYVNENCPYDGEPCANLHVHHIQPVRAGGTNDPENLITIFSCEHISVCPERRIKYD